MSNAASPRSRRWPWLLLALLFLLLTAGILFGPRLVQKFASRDVIAGEQGAGKKVIPEPIQEPRVVAEEKSGGAKLTPFPPLAAADKEAPTEEVRALLFSSDGKWLASAGDDKIIRLWDLKAKSRKAELHGHKQAVVALAFTPDSRTLASAGQEGEVKLWDLAGDEPKERAEIGGMGAGIAFSPDGTILATTNWFRVQLWNVTEPAPKSGPAMLGELGQLVHSVSFAADGQTLAFAGSDGKVRIWDLTGKTPRPRLVLAGNAGSLAEFSPAGPTLATAHREGLRLWEITGDKARETATLAATGPAQHVSFAADGKTVAFSCEDRSIHVWRLAGADTTRIAAVEHAGNAVALSPDGKTLAVGGAGRRISLWNVIEP